MMLKKLGEFAKKALGCRRVSNIGTAELNDWYKRYQFHKQVYLMRFLDPSIIGISFYEADNLVLDPGQSYLKVLEQTKYGIFDPHVCMTFRYEAGLLRKHDSRIASELHEHLEWFLLALKYFKLNPLHPELSIAYTKRPLDERCLPPGGNITDLSWPKGTGYENVRTRKSNRKLLM